MPKKKLDTGVQSIDNNVSEPLNESTQINTNLETVIENGNNISVNPSNDDDDDEPIKLNNNLSITESPTKISDSSIEIKNNINHRVSQNKTPPTKNLIQKPGKTLFIKLINNNETFDLNILDTITGLINKTNITPKKTLFLTFDSIDNSMKAYYKLYSQGYKNNYIVRYSYYKIFFTMTGLTTETVYTDTKKKLIEYINTKTDTNILYCKFYCKNNTYLGCGELTVDTLEGLNIILSDAYKKFEFDTFTGNFYKYNKK